MSPSGKGPLRIAIEDFIESFRFDKTLLVWIRAILEDLENEAVDFYAEIVEMLGVGEALPEAMRPSAINKRWKRQPVQLVPILMMAGGIVIGFIFGAIRPMVDVASYKTDHFTKSARVDAATSRMMMRRTTEHSTKLKEGLYDQGWSDDLIDAWEILTQQTMSAGELEVLRRKGYITDTYFKKELNLQGWTDERIQQITGLRDLIPGAGDLISMAVREAFDPGIVQSLGYDQNFPSEFAGWMEKQGFDAEWAKKYWYSHWILPSINQGVEMLHRLRPGTTGNPFTEDDFRTLLRIQDVAPFYRERLTEIGYNPLTRVDVRRMYTMGVLTEDEVKQSYLDLGYNDLNATRMTDFTIRFERQEERGLTRAAIQASYKRGITGRGDALSQLSAMGYPDDISDFYLDIIDFDLAAQQTDEKLEAIRQLYISGILDESTIQDKIGSLNLPSERQLALLEVWTIQRDNRVNLPSRSELDDFYRRGLIDTDFYRDTLKREGYQSNVVTLFTQRIDDIVQREAQMEAERAQKEQERLDRALLKTDYQVDKAAVDLQIAEANLAIADIKVALHQLADPDEISGLKLRIKEINLMIAELRLVKAQVRLTYEIEG